jgi:hypothetical protein
MLWTDGDVVDSAMQSGDYLTIHLQARSEPEHVVANVWIPSGCRWRP